MKRHALPKDPACIEIENALQAADALAKSVRTEAERDNFMHPNIRTALANYDKARNA